MKKLSELRQFFRFGFLIVLSGLLILAHPKPASAHPLGNFSVNRYSRLTVEVGYIHLFYVLDMAEIPTFQVWPEIDRDGDGMISESENAAYLSTLIDTLQKNLSLKINGSRLSLALQKNALTFPAGQGDLPTLRVEAEFLVTFPNTEKSWRVSYADNNYADRLGWQEVIVQSLQGVTLLESSVPSEDLTQALRQYPEDLLQSPLSVSSAEFFFAPGGNAGQPEIATSNVEAPVENRFNPDQFAELITINEQNPVVLVGVLALAFGLGAAHALTPGHGKTLVGAYLVGARGTPKHALFLGLTTTITHTAGVFFFGLLVLFASQFILPERLYPWLGVLSGILVLGIGLSLLRERWRNLHRGTGTQHHGHPHHDHTHADHHHPHSHAHEHDHHHNDHPHHHHVPEEISWRSLLALGISGGLLPCPSALVLLLSAIALGRVGFGLMLILAFSLGLAGVLTGIGLVLVYAGRLFDRLPSGGGRLLRVLPVASALFISFAGLGITFQALVETGLL